jgi:UMF1 family MFS transporter
MGVVDLVGNGALPEIAADHPGGLGAVSSRGIAWGYAGGGTLLAADLALLQLHDSIGLTEGGAVRICFLAAGLWWFGFGTPAARRLFPAATNEEADETPARAPGLAALRGQLSAGIRLFGRMPQARRYLFAYLFFSDAVTGVASLASTYLTHELVHNDSDKAAPFLFELILMIQFTAVLGAWAFGRLARSIGLRHALAVSLVLWVAVVVYAWAGMRTTGEAACMGVAVGIGLGSNAALARTAFADMIPRGREGTFFSLYEVASNGTAWLAPLVFTLVVNATGSFRQAILSLVILFAAGLVLLLRTDLAEAAREARAVEASD